jgi:hypothetical protein
LRQCATPVCAYAILSTSYHATPSYGSSDYRVIRIDADGRQIWDRPFGGYAFEYARFLAETEDGGLIVGGYSASDNISGNKGVIGAGTWCLKLDGSGAKEAELLLPSNYDNYWTMLPKPSGFSLIGWGTNCCAEIISADLNALRRASVTARAVDDRPFNLDVSSNLVDWTRVVTGFTAELRLLEPFTEEKKFYRVWEP